MIVSLCAFLSAWCAREPPIQLPDEDKARKFEEVDNILPSARYDAKDPVEAARRLMAISSRSGRGSRQAAAKGKAGGGAAATPFNWREDWRTSYRSNFAKEHGGRHRLCEHRAHDRLALGMRDVGTASRLSSSGGSHRELSLGPRASLWELFLGPRIWL